MDLYEIVHSVSNAFSDRPTVLTDALRSDPQTGAHWRTFQVSVPAAENADAILSGTVLPLMTGAGWSVVRRSGGAGFARDGMDVGVLIGRSVVVGGSSAVWRP